MSQYTSPLTVNRTEDMEPIGPRDYYDAIAVHSAVNLSGVVLSYAKVLLRIRASGIVGTREVNRHPISVMYASAIIELAGAGMGNESAFSRAYDECKRQCEAAGMEVPS